MPKIIEGTDYITLQKPITNADNTLIEVYSYACPFCYKYQKLLPNIIKELPENIIFKPFHIEQKSAYGKQASQILAIAAINDKKADADTSSIKSTFHNVESAYYESYHKQKNGTKTKPLILMDF